MLYTSVLYDEPFFFKSLKLDLIFITSKFNSPDSFCGKRLVTNSFKTDWTVSEMKYAEGMTSHYR
jgi:hypothetical protein